MDLAFDDIEKFFLTLKENEKTKDKEERNSSELLDKLIDVYNTDGVSKKLSQYNADLRNKSAFQGIDYVEDRNEGINAKATVSSLSSLLLRGASGFSMYSDYKSRFFATPSSIVMTVAYFSVFYIVEIVKVQGLYAGIDYEFRVVEAHRYMTGNEPVTVGHLKNELFSAVFVEVFKQCQPDEFEKHKDFFPHRVLNNEHFMVAVKRLDYSCPGCGKHVSPGFGSIYNRCRDHELQWATIVGLVLVSRLPKIPINDQQMRFHMSRSGNTCKIFCGARELCDLNSSARTFVFYLMEKMPQFENDSEEQLDRINDFENYDIKIDVDEECDSDRSDSDDY